MQLMTQSAQIVSVERRTLDGRPYVVAPVVAMVAGVLNGILTPAEEIAAFVETWNGRPVPVRHPKADGQFISANSPGVVEQQVIGALYGARFEGDRLKGELWLDVEKAEKLGGDALEVLERIEQGQQVEVSTAYFHDYEERQGTFNGKRYTGIARNIHPDHVAVLPDELGACSWKDGCGVPRVNAMLDEFQDSVMVGFFLRAEDGAALALDDQSLPEGSEVLPAGELHVTLAYLGKVGEQPVDERRVLSMVMDIAKWEPILRATVSGIGRFNADEGEMQALYLSVDAPGLASFREMVVSYLEEFCGCTVGRRHSFTPHVTLAYVPADAPTAMVPPPARELVLDALTVAWGERRTVFPLQGLVMSDAQPADEGGVAANVGQSPRQRVARRTLAALGKMLVWNEEVPAVGDEEAGAIPFEVEADSELSEEDEMAEQEKEQGQQTEPVEQPVVQPATNAALEGLTPEVVTGLRELAAMVNDLGGVQAVRESIQLLRTNRDEGRKALISELTANQWCAFGEQELQGFSTEQLQKLAQSLRVPDYGGRGAVRTHQADPEWEEYTAPA